MAGAVQVEVNLLNSLVNICNFDHVIASQGRRVSFEFDSKYQCL